MNFRILVLALGSFAIGTDGFMIAGILSSIAQDLGISVEVCGQMITAFAIAYAISSPILATLTGSMSRKKLLILSLIVFTLANVLAAFSTTYWMLLIARVFAAFGAALFMPSANVMAASLVPPERRGWALSIVNGGLTVANALGVPIGTWIGTHFSWQTTFGIVAILGVVGIIGVLTSLPAVPTPPAVPLSVRLSPLKNGRTLAALSVSTLWMIGGFTVLSYVTAILLQVAPLHDVGLTSMMLIYGLSTVIGNSIGGHGADNWGPRATIISSLLILIATFFGISLMATYSTGSTVSLVIMALLMVVWGISAWMTQSPQQHRLISLMPQAPAIIMSLNGSALYVGISLGALIGGIVLRSAGVTALGWVGGGIELLTLVILVLSSRPAASPVLTEQETAAK